MGHAARMSVLLAVTASSMVLGGCPSGLTTTMKGFGFTAMNPPTVGWEAGAIVEVGNDRFLPQPILFPSTAGIEMPARWLRPMPAPDVSKSHEQHFTLGVGLSIPDWLSTQIQAKYENASRYSVVASGNRLAVVQMLEYYPDFQSMVKYAKAKSPPDGILPYVERGNTAWISQLWLADSLEYRFYDSNDVTIDLKIPIELPVDASIGWSQTDEGSLVYKGDAPICLGYIARQITRQAAMGTGPLRVPPIQMLTQELNLDIGLTRDDFRNSPTAIPMSWGGVDHPRDRALIK